MSEYQQIARRISEISEQIASGYMSEEQIEDFINLSNSHLYVSVDGEIDSYKNFKSINPADIQGFLTSKSYSSFESFASDVEYSDYLEESKYNESQMFPSFNMKTMAVEAENQGKGIGTRLATHALGVASKKDEFPVVARMWRKSGRRNGHIQTAKEVLNAEVIGQDDSFLNDYKCKICEEFDCDCSEVYVVFSE